MLLKEVLPTEEGLKGDVKELTDPFYRPETEGMLGQYAENEEQAVSAVRNDGIRKYGVGGRPPALAADQAADTKADLHRPAINEFDQGAVVVAVVTHLTLASAARTDLSSRSEMIHTTLKDRFSGSFFTDKLAIDQVFSYHNSALRTM